MATDPLEVLLEDARCVRYRPSLARALGGVLPAVLLGHLLEAWSAGGRRAFGLFDAPADDARFRPGSSLEEALGAAPEELEHAFALLEDAGGGGPVVRSWRDEGGMRWVEVDATAVRRALAGALGASASNGGAWGAFGGADAEGPEAAARLLRRHLGRFYERMLAERPERRAAWAALGAAEVRRAVDAAQGMPGHFVTRLRERLDEASGLEAAPPNPALPPGSSTAGRGAGAGEAGDPDGGPEGDPFGSEADPAALARFLAKAGPELREATLSRFSPALAEAVREEMAAQAEARARESRAREEEGARRRSAQVGVLLRSLSARMDLGAALPPEDGAQSGAGSGLEAGGGGSSGPELEPFLDDDERRDAAEREADRALDALLGAGEGAEGQREGGAPEGRDGGG